MTGDHDLTPDEAALYGRLFGPDAPKPTSQPTRLRRTYSGTDEELDRGRGAEELHRGDRPSRDVLKIIPRAQRRAEVLCANRRGRPYVVALVTTWPEGVRGSVVTVNPHDKLVVLGHDFRVECPCGMTHEVDGTRLRSAVLSLDRHARKTPTVDVFDVERIT